MACGKSARRKSQFAQRILARVESAQAFRIECTNDFGRNQARPQNRAGIRFEPHRMKTSFTVSEQSELLILADGKILAHNITSEMAAILCELDPENNLMRQRARIAAKPVTNR